VNHSTRLIIAGTFLSLAGCASAHASASADLANPDAVTVRASAPSNANPESAKLEAAEIRALETSIRGLLLKNLPDPIVKSDRGWGRQKEAVVRARILRSRTGLEKGKQNDGVWRRVSLRAVNPAKSLALGITEAKFPAPGRASFTAMIGADCALKFEQQIWRNGIRLYSGETRGRCHAAVLLKCEVASRTETKPGSFVPDLIFRVKVVEAKLFYEKLVIEHTAGVGGSAAISLLRRRCE
jgi:hypothetical protein